MYNIKRVLTLSVALLLSLTVLGCTKSEQVTKDTTLDLTSSNTGDPGSPNVPKQVPNTPVVEIPMPDIKLDSTLIYQPTETIEDGDLSFSKFKCLRTAQLPQNIQSDKFIYRDGDTEPNTSTLAGSKEYIFAEIEISNNSQTTVLYNTGSLAFIIASGDLIQIERTGEPRYFSAGGDVTKKDFFNLTLNPNEKKTITLGYILDKATLGNNALYYTVGKDADAGYAIGNSSEPFVVSSKCFAAKL